MKPIAPTKPTKPAKPAKPTLHTQHTLTDIECGVDEVARGCLFGRVYAGAVVWRLPSASHAPIPHPILPKDVVIRDSKTMSRAQRERADEWIRKEAVAVGLAHRDEAYVDRHNIRQAAHDAMADAIRNTQQQLHVATGNHLQLALIDGDGFAPSGETVQPVERVVPMFRVPTAVPDTSDGRSRSSSSSDSLPPYRCVIKGDNTYFSIACAAIVAKVAHDRYIHELCDAHPELDTRYDVRKNVGYGTAKHRGGLRTYGPSAYHRMTFGGVAGGGVAGGGVVGEGVLGGEGV